MKARLAEYKEGKLIKTYPLPEPGTTIGRDQENHIRLDAPLVSRRHCAVHAKDGMWVIKDLSSTNGTKVNGAVVANAVLKHGDSIVIGPFHFIFETTSGQADSNEGPEQSPTSRYRPSAEDDRKPRPAPETMQGRTLRPKPGGGSGGA